MPRKRKRNAGLGLHHCKKAAKITDDPNRVNPFGRPKKFEHPIRSPPKQKKRKKNMMKLKLGGEVMMMIIRIFRVKAIQVRLRKWRKLKPRKLKPW